MGSLEELFRALDGVELADLRLDIEADDNISAVQRFLSQGDLSQARSRLDSSILQARGARRALLFEAGELHNPSFNLTGYLVDLHCRRANLLRRTDDLAAARADYALAHVLDPRPGVPAQFLVETYESMGRADMALSLLTRLYRKDPGSLGLALVRLMSSTRAQGGGVDLVQPALTALVEDDTSGLFRAVAGQLALPDAERPAPEALEMSYHRATEAFSQGRLEEVSDLLLPVLAWVPDYSLAWFLYGVSSLLRSDLSLPDLSEWGPAGLVATDVDQQGSAAVAALTSAAFLAPDVALHWVELARAYLFTSKFSEAARAATEAIRLGPDEATAHALLAFASLALDDRPTMMRALQDSLRLDPAHPIAQKIVDWLDLVMEHGDGDRHE